MNLNFQGKVAFVTGQEAGSAALRLWPLPARAPP